ncbi:MAG: IS5 family transposase [Acidobacteriota bacterium]|nr:IS5 family transposase [Acidobacteriota bacterium]
MITTNEGSLSQRPHQLEQCLPRRQCGEVKKRGNKEVGFSGKHRIKGIKRHFVVDAHGHPLNFTISKANWSDQRNLLATVDSIRIGKRRRRPKRLGLDKGYDSEPLRRELRRRRITPNAPYRKNHVSIPLGRPPKDKRERRYNRQRWKVERSFAWINNNRRLSQFLEESQRSYRAFLHVFMVKYYLNLMF